MILASNIWYIFVVEKKNKICWYSCKTDFKEQLIASPDFKWLSWVEHTHRIKDDRRENYGAYIGFISK